MGKEFRLSPSQETIYELLKRKRSATSTDFVKAVYGRSKPLTNERNVINTAVRDLIRKVNRTKSEGYRLSMHKQPGTRLLEVRLTSR